MRSSSRLQKRSRASWVLAVPEQVCSAGIPRGRGLARFGAKTRLWKAFYGTKPTPSAFYRGPADLWVQASLEQKQRLQQLFYPEGVAFDGIRFNRTAATAPLFRYLEPAEGAEERLVGAGGIEPPTPRV